MKVQVYFFGNFRNITGRAEQTIGQLPEGATIRELLDKIINQYTKLTTTLSHENLQESNVRIVHNEKPVKEFESTLTEGDKLYFFIFLSGG
ncbi:MAG: MoaD/ThiS family protein [Spirochaetales bacterium]|nr:MoaD/ThiS family protein [Spirochaetales bacterium]